jgi:hypothetical protein
MKKNILAAGVLLLSIAAGSCKKEAATNATGKSTSIKGIVNSVFQNLVPPDGRIAMINDGTQTRYGSYTSTFSFNGRMPDNSNFSNISFNNYNVDITAQELYASSTIDTPVLRGMKPQFFGSTTSMSINGQNVVSGFYIPKDLEVTFASATGNNSWVFNSSAGISFSWNPDPLNANATVVVLSYTEENAAEGSQVLTKEFIYPAGTNSATISASDLADFPTGQKIVMYIATGNQQNFNFAGKSYELLGLNITTLPGIMLQ